MRVYSTIAGLTFALMLAMPALSQAGAIQIESDKMTVYHKTNQVVFTGNVHLTRDAFEMFCDKLVAYYSDSDLERADASGNVRLKHGKVTGTANQALLDQKQNTLTLSGNAVMQQNGSRVEGEQIVHHIDQERTIVLPAKGGRTHMTIESDETGGTMMPGAGKP